MFMDDENKLDWIDKYLAGELAKEEIEIFEEKMRQDPAFKEEVDVQKQAFDLTLHTLEEINFRTEINNWLTKEEKWMEEQIQTYLNLPPYPLNNPKEVKKRKEWFWFLLIGILLGIIALFIYIFYSLKEKENTNARQIDSNPVSKKKHEHKSSGSYPIHTQLPEEQKKPEVIQKEPKLDSIPEWILKQTIGYAGNARIEKTMRLLLLYADPPSNEIKDQSLHYYLEDTLKIFGQVKPSALMMIYEEPRGKYYLVYNKDTLAIQYRSMRWEKLPVHQKF